MTNFPKIYLASKSPRRRKLLSLFNFDLESFSVQTPEDLIPGELPADTVRRLAKEKLDEAVKLNKEGIIITADTVVVLNGKIIGKPLDEQDAFNILKLLSGNTHTVFTGFSLLNTINNKLVIEHVETDVTFRMLDDDEIWQYVKSGSPMDKAGAYGIQDDYGAVFVERLNGCYYNVVGLPLSKLYKSLKEII